MCPLITCVFTLNCSALYLLACSQEKDALQLHTPTNRKGQSANDWVSSALLDDLLRQYRGATDAAEAKVGG